MADNLLHIGVLAFLCAAIQAFAENKANSTLFHFYKPLRREYDSC